MGPAKANTMVPNFIILILNKSASIWIKWVVSNISDQKPLYYYAIKNIVNSCLEMEN